jgi:hypothetical protein
MAVILEGGRMSRTALIGLALLAVTGAGGCIIVDDGGDSSFTVDNQSDYVLTEVRIAEVGDRSWGPNLLPDVLFPGEALTIHGIDCGDYDVLVRDDTGVDCILGNIELCFDHDAWVVDNFTLDICAFN